MPKPIVTPAARADIKDTLLYSKREHGDAGRRRYSLLVRNAIRYIGDHPAGLGSTERADIGAGIYVYHLRSARLLTRAPADQVKRPRYFVVYQKALDNGKPTVVLLRVLSDTWEIAKHLVTLERPAASETQAERRNGATGGGDR